MTNDEFKVGETVVFDGREDVEIMFIADEPDVYGFRYAVCFSNGRAPDGLHKGNYYTFVSEDNLAHKEEKNEN
jgi:hypothetical protein